EGFTWTRVGDAITGAGPTTGSATFNNTAGPIVADPVSHNVYSIFASGEVGILKAKTTDFNNIFVSRSTDAGKHWTPVLVFAGPLLSTNANVFPAVAVDPANGNVYATWSNASGAGTNVRSEEHTSELQSRSDLVCRLLLEKKKKKQIQAIILK